MEQVESEQRDGALVGGRKIDILARERYEATEALQSEHGNDERVRAGKFSAAIHDDRAGMIAGELLSDLRPRKGTPIPPHSDVDGIELDIAARRIFVDPFLIRRRMTLLIAIAEHDALDRGLHRAGA